MMYGNWFRNGNCFLGGGFSIWHGLMLLGVIVIIGAIFFMIKGRSHNSNSIELLKNQYVNGNITEEEYLDRKNVLERK